MVRLMRGISLERARRDTTSGGPASRRDAVALRRWLVQLALILGFVLARVLAVLLSRRYAGHSGTTNHAIVGLVVLALAVVHVSQRRRTIRGLLRGMTRGGSATRHRPGRAGSDLTLWLLTLNATVSVVADLVTGQTIYLLLPGPYVLQKWGQTRYTVSVLVLLGFVITHVVRRRGRLRGSHIS